MTKNPFDDDGIRTFIAKSESPMMKLARDLENSPTAQVTRMIQQHDLTRLSSAVQQASVAIDAYTKSQQWAELSAAVRGLNAILREPATVSALRRIAEDLKMLALAANHAVLPTAKAMSAFTDSAALAIRPLRAHFKDISEWQSSVSQRMATIAVPWAMEEHLGVSVVGFARISRLHDLAASTEPFGKASVEIFDEELGAPVPYEYDDDNRDAAAIDAGLNPEVVAFPDEAYPPVLFSAGFEFRVERLAPIRSDKGDASGAFDPQHNALWNQVENRLRSLVARELRQFVGEQWDRSRVPGTTRQRWLERRDKDRSERGDSYELIFYADFMDLSEIICRRDNWKDLFQRFFVSKEDFQVSMSRLHPVRKALGHSRPLARADQLILFSEATRILNALGVKLA